MGVLYFDCYHLSTMRVSSLNASDGVETILSLIVVREVETYSIIHRGV